MKRLPMTENEKLIRNLITACFRIAQSGYNGGDDFRKYHELAEVEGVKLGLLTPSSEPKLEMRSRGCGMDSGPCLICGETAMNKNFASFAQSKEDGDAIVKLFESHDLFARLDWRPREPTWIQVKVTACAKHEPQLVHLEEMISRNQYVNPDILNGVNELGGL